MEKERNILNDMITNLWQGRSIDMERLTNTIDKIVNDIMSGAGEMKKRGIDFPIEYVIGAMKNISQCIESRDSFLLADCLCYEWLEIMDVYNEVMDEIG